MTSAYPDEPGIDPDKWEESPQPDRDNEPDHQGIANEESGNEANPDS